MDSHPRASMSKDMKASITDIHNLTRDPTSFSDPEDNISSGVESFDEDDMYGSDNGDDIVSDVMDNMLPDSSGNIQAHPRAIVRLLLHISVRGY
jgi:hypothetical protein